MVIVVSRESSEVLRKIILDAEKWIKLASFLLYDEDLCNLLSNKRRSGVEVQILTTPPEAAEKEEIRVRAEAIQSKLRRAGAEVTACDFEVGQPELTMSTRAGGRTPRWFGMHTKFLATDKCAAVMSSDILESFSADTSWNSHVIYTNESRIRLLCDKYAKLKEIAHELVDSLGPDFVDLSVKPRKLVRGYPLQGKSEPLREDGFYLLPHEGGGRATIEKAIMGSERFAFLLFETIYDDALSQVLMKKLITQPSLDFRIITSPLSAYVQNPWKTRARFIQLASYGARIKTLKGLRAKMLITDRMIISGSFDLVKMGVGFKRSGKWVQSTEIMDVSTDERMIEEAKREYSRIFDSLDEEYGKWFTKEASGILHIAGAARVSREAKELLGYMIFDKRRKSYDWIKKASLVAVEIARLRNKGNPYVKAEDVQKADQLLILFRRNELTEAQICQIIGVLDAGSFFRRLKDSIFLLY